MGEDQKENTIKVQSLKDILTEEGDLNSDIFYLSADLRLSGGKILQDWFDTGALKNVKQINLDILSGSRQMPTDNAREAKYGILSGIFAITKKFELFPTSYSPDSCLERSHNTDGENYYPYFSVTLQKKSSNVNIETTKEWLKTKLGSEEFITKTFKDLDLPEDPDLLTLKATVNQALSVKSYHSCMVSKTIGGYWHDKSKCFDGGKFICLDNFPKLVEKKECLIYSFDSVNKRSWNFEKEMAKSGCTVKTFTINPPKAKKFGLVSKEELIGSKTNRKMNKLTRNAIDINTLDEILAQNGDSDKIISYLVLDVETQDLDVLKYISEKKIAEKIDQIQMRVRVGKQDLPKGKECGIVLKNLLEGLRKLVLDYNFTMLDSSPNFCSEKETYMYSDKFFPEVDIVLYKQH